MTLALTAIILAILITVVAFVINYETNKQHRSLQSERDLLADKIKEAKRRHAPRKHLYKSISEYTLKQLKLEGWR